MARNLISSPNDGLVSSETKFTETVEEKRKQLSFAGRNCSVWRHDAGHFATGK